MPMNFIFWNAVITDGVRSEVITDDVRSEGAFVL